jgi:hypothetical protein
LQPGNEELAFLEKNIETRSAPAVAGRYLAVLFSISGIVFFDSWILGFQIKSSAFLL